MVFNSLAFGLFLPAVLLLHWGAAPRFRNPVLLVASYVFYAFWDWRFLGLLVLSTVVDYSVGRALGYVSAEGDDGETSTPRTIALRRHRRRLLVVSLGVNLGVLAAFKYANFFVQSLDDLGRSVGWSLDQSTLSILLPVGISFYTFQTMSYTIDVYRGRLEPVRDPILFATYVAYFPQLVAGPIERARHLIPRLADTGRGRPVRSAVEGAVGLIMLGLFKKVVIADGVAVVADALFDNPGDASTLVAVAGILAFSLQIYGDFSGYTDIARGVSQLFGIDLVVNFREPYLSRNITEFWRRWHISLSNWLRDYLYIPLGGNRGSRLLTDRNLMVTMLLGGLWHGASWTFVVWGALHGLYLIVDRTRGATASDRPLRATDVPAVLGTFTLVSLTWVFFRAGTFGDAIAVFGALARPSIAIDLGHLVLVAGLTMLMLVVDLIARRVQDADDLLERRPTAVGIGVGIALLGIIVFSGSAARPFVYFQF